MKGNSADDKHNETLRRIAALLLALADLAERAACRSWPVRHLVLWLLRPAERAARAFAAQAGCAVSPLFPVDRLVCPGPSDGPEDAARVARQFRALAAAFSALACQAPGSPWVARRPDPGRRRPGRRDAVWLYRLLLALQPLCADTS